MRKIPFWAAMSIGFFIGVMVTAVAISMRPTDPKIVEDAYDTGYQYGVIDEYNWWVTTANNTVYTGTQEYQIVARGAINSLIKDVSNFNRRVKYRQGSSIATK